MERSVKILRIISALVLVLTLLTFIVGCGKSSGNGGSAPYNFDTYDTLEVTVSDSEKFILTISPELVDDVDPDNMRFAGYGDWQKDGVTYPVYFFERDFNDVEEAPDGCRGFVIVYDFRRVAEYEVYVPDDFYAIAMIVNDGNNPIIKRWVSGDVDFPSYSAKWAAGESVSITTKKSNG